MKRILIRNLSLLGCALAIVASAPTAASPDPTAATHPIRPIATPVSPTVALTHGTQSGITHTAAVIRLPFAESVELWTGRVHSHWQVEAGRWEPRTGNAVNHAAAAWHVSWQPGTAGVIRPYVEAAVGLAVFDHTQVGVRRLGSHLHFTEQIGAGLQLGHGWRVGWRYVHYSNAGLRPPNDGVDMHALTVQWTP